MFSTAGCTIHTNLVVLSFLVYRAFAYPTLLALMIAFGVSLLASCIAIGGSFA